MTYDLSPSIPDIIEYQLPAEVRRPENALFTAFLKHYYTWLTANGQPTDFLQNIAKYTDLDLSSGEFRTHLTKTLLKFVPASANIDKTLLVKHLNHFLKSKGTYESFQFIMRAIYGEDLELIWNSNRILRASANAYKRDASIAVESTNPWTLTNGAHLIQELPNAAIAGIESCVTTLVNGKNINWLELNDKTIIGDFIPNSEVKVLRNTINRNWNEITTYYSPISYANGLIAFKVIEEELRPYDNLVVKQLNSNFRGIVDYFVKRVVTSNFSVIYLQLKNYTGTFNLNEEIYIIPAAIENQIIIKTDYDFGIVSPSVGNINISSPGALYIPGDKVTLSGGNGVNADAYVLEVTNGGITSVDILAKGYGYSIGDKISVNGLNSGGIGFDASVSSIDGIGANITLTTELNSISIVNGGSGYAVNDEIEILGGNRIVGVVPARFRITSVTSTWGFLGVSIDNGGYDYLPFTKIALINVNTLAKISGFTANPIIVNGTITAVNITALPTISTNQLKVIANGYGAIAHAILVNGVITSIVVDNVGVNYIDPVVDVIGDGFGAVLTPIMTSDTITAITVEAGGHEYASISLVIHERNGAGSAFTPIFRDQSLSQGTITAVTILSRGQYLNVPNCHEAIGVTKIGIGVGATFAYDFRGYLASLVDGGQFYHAVTKTISGKGSGAVLSAEQTSGVITRIIVLSGGKDYYYGTTVTIPTVGTACSLTPVMIDGKIVSVTINSGGSGYAPPELTGITITSGTDMTLTTPISASGKVVNYEIIDGGRGYYSSAEVPPLNLSISGGSGALLVPFLNSFGGIEKVDVLRGGSGYGLTETITVTGGGGSLANLIPASVNGMITDVIVSSTGTGYKYGTKALLFGDGTGAAITPIIETGLTNVEVTYGGYGYGPNTTITVTDSTGPGSGAEVRPIIVNGSISHLELVNKGSGYLTPVLSTTDYSAQRILFESGDPAQLENNGFIIYEGAYNNVTASLSASAIHPISSFTITSEGSGYTYAEVLIVGDGKDAQVSLTVEKLGTVETAAVNAVGAGYTATPIVTITDISGYGAVSGIKINNSGSGFSSLPVLLLNDKRDINNNITATGARFTCFGDNIGGVKMVAFNHHGADYFDLPKAIFNIKAILQENAAFLVGETITARSGIYRNSIVSSKILLEDGTFLIKDASDYQITFESGDPIGLEQNEFFLLNEYTVDSSVINLTLDFDDVMYDLGLTGIVERFDYATNTITIGSIGDNFIFESEEGNEIITENCLDIVDQQSGTFEIGDVITGSKSFGQATIKHLLRPEAVSYAGGAGYTAFTYVDDVGMLNNAHMVIADNQRYQDRAYVMQTGRSLSDYSKTIKDTVHPAGFALYGDVKTQTFKDAEMMVGIGYKELILLLAILSYGIDEIYRDYSTMDELYGELNKFRHAIPIAPIKNYTIRQSSLISIATVDAQYNSYPLNANPSTWTMIGGAGIIQNDGIAPSGSNTFTKISDSSSINTAYIQTSLSTTIGHNCTFETYIGKQVNPTTWPEIAIGSIYFKLNTETGEYLTNSTSYMDIEDMGDYWWIRIGYTAIATSTSFTISPAKGFIADLVNSNIVATGSIHVADTYIRDVNGLTPFSAILRASNSLYSPMVFPYNITEIDLTYPAIGIAISNNIAHGYAGTVV